MELLEPQQENDLEALLSQVETQHQTILDQSERIEELESQLEWFKRQLFGRKTERIEIPGQLDLFSEQASEEAAPPAVETESIEYSRRKPKRNPLPKTLPRERIELDVEASDKVCPCCDGPRRRIGEAATEELAFQPARFWVREFIRPKYACPRCEEGGVVTAAVPPRPIPKGLFGPEVLAHLLVSKFEDHLPLHRQLKMFRREGIELRESTVNDAVLQSAEYISCLLAPLKAHMLKASRIFTDDTPVVLKSNVPGGSQKARLWVYIRQGEKGWPATLFDFTEDRARDGPLKVLDRFIGYLQADAYGGYDGLYASGRIAEVGCWSHARRYFEQAARLHKKSGRAHAALDTIRSLFAIEREIKKLSPFRRFWIRRERALPILRQFKTWLDQQYAEVSAKSKFGLAVSYTLNQWQALVEYVNHGELEISNNIAENTLRPIAVGRNYVQSEIMLSMWLSLCQGFYFPCQNDRKIWVLRLTGNTQTV